MAGIPEQVRLQPPYQDNPFLILGLSSSATIQEIQAKYAEAQIKARFDRNGDTDAKLDQLRQAQAQLLDPTKRRSFQALWFFDPDPSLEEGLTPASTVFQRYLMYLDDRSAGDQQLHDGANALLLAACHADDPEAIISFCSAALEAGDELGRGEATLAAFSAAVMRCAEEQDFGKLKAYATSCQDSSISNEDAEVIFTSALRRASTLFASKIEEIAAQVRFESTTVSDLVAAANTISTIANNFRDSVESFGEEFPGHPARFLDDASTQLRSIAIRLHNDHTSTWQAIRVMTDATRLCSSVELSFRLNEDLKELHYQAAYRDLGKAIQEKRWNDAAAACRLALTYARTDEEREELRAAATGIEKRRTATQGNFPWGWAVVGVFVVIGIISVFVSGSSDDSQSGSVSGGAPRTFATATPASVQSTSSLTNSQRLAAIERELDSLENRAITIENRYDDICRRYRQAGTTCTVPATQYNELIDLERQHDALRRRYDSLVNEYNSLLR